MKAVVITQLYTFVMYTSQSVHLKLVNFIVNYTSTKLTLKKKKGMHAFIQQIFTEHLLCASKFIPNLSA